jgi:hypothetical protein
MLRRRERSFPCWETNPSRPAGSSSLYRLNYPNSNCSIEGVKVRVAFNLNRNEESSEFGTRNEKLINGKRLLYEILISLKAGRAVAQAVSPWLPTAAARVRVRVACGVCGAQSGTGAGFLRVLRFPPANHHSTSFSIIIIIRGWHNRSIGGRSAQWTQLDSTPYYTNLLLIF